MFLFGIVLAFLAGVSTLFFPLEYRADSQVFIISESRYGVDPYTVIKSAERVGENISRVMETSDFYEKVMNQEGFSIDKSRFERLEVLERREKWANTIEGSVVYGTGVLNISTYSNDSEQARQLAGAALSALSTQGWEYVGGDVTIKVVNEPVVTRYPVRPNILVNMAAGFVIGVLLMGAIVLRRR